MVFAKLLRNVWIHERRGKHTNALYGGSYYGGNGRQVEIFHVDLEKRELLVHVSIDLSKSGWAWVGVDYLELPTGATLESLAAEERIRQAG